MNFKIKHAIKVCIYLIAFYIIFTFLNYIETHYKKDMVVVSIQENTITISDNQGNLYEYLGDNIDIGDCVIATMHNHYTDNDIMDDSVVKIKKVR